MKKYKYKEYIANVFPCLTYGIACGSVTGAVIFLFRLGAKYAEEISRHLYGVAKGSMLYVAAEFAVLIAFALAMSFLLKKIPEVKGGGIPRSEGILRGILSLRPIMTFTGTVIGSMISFFCGLPLGSEGPAVLIGTSIGSMCGSVSKNQTAWNRYVMTGGAGAGFAVATGSPLSGILFALEEIHKRFTPMLVLTVSVSVISATCVNRLLCSAFGISPSLFEIEKLAEFELSHIGYLLLLGVIIALAVAVFDGSISLHGKLIGRFSKFVPNTAKIIFIFVTTGILGFLFTDGIYSGHDVIHDLLTYDKTVIYLILLFVLRLAMMLLVTDSGVTGGIFIPTLAIGAVAGALAAKFLIAIGMPAELFQTLLLLSMCAFIGGTLRAPLTAAILFIELTGQFTDLFYVALVIFTVNLVTGLLNQTPFYDHALDNIIKADNKGREPMIDYFEMKVSDNAFVIGKAIRDVMWPNASAVISITRANKSQKDMDNDGEKKLYAGDTIVMRSRYYDESEIKKQLCGLVGSDYEIKKLDSE